MTMDCPVKALWLRKHYGVRYIWMYTSRIRDGLVRLEAYEFELLALLRGEYNADYCKALYVHPEGMKKLNALPRHEKEALQYLDLWPLEPTAEDAPR